MTLAKLAELASVSVGTVSKAFKGSGEISKKTRNKIFEIAKKHGCFDKYYKAPRKRPIIALLAPEPEGEYYGNEIGILERALYERGADTVIAFTRFDSQLEARLFHVFAYEMKVDGFIIFGNGELIKNPDKIPIVAFAAPDNAPDNSDAVTFDTENAITELMQLIKDYGHTNVGFIGEELTHQKKTLLRRAMRSVGLPVHDKYMVTSAKRFAEAGIDGMEQLIDVGDLPSVIFAAYDEIAYGAMQYAEKRGYKIPDDISFVGMDDLLATPYLGTPLTSLHTELEKISSLIAELIFKKIENKHYVENSEIIVPVTTTIRESLKNLNENS